MANPRWDDVRVFLAVARAESLSGAGRRLKMDAATVGRRVARLEADVEAPLFVKSPQGYTLTAAGERLVTHCERAERELHGGMEAITGSTDRLSGQIRIGAPDGCATYLLPQVCQAIVRDNPDLDIQIVAQPRVVNLSRREADLAITVSPPTAGQLLVQRITDYRLHLVASQDYLETVPPICTPDDLSDGRMIGYIPDMIFDAELDYLHDLGFQRVVLASNSVPVQLRLTESGAGFCVAHDFSLPSHPKLRKILPNDIALKRSFYLVRHQTNQRSESLNRFCVLLVEAIKNEVARLEGVT